MINQRFQVYLGDNYARDSVADVPVAKDILHIDLAMLYADMLQNENIVGSGYWGHWADNDLRLSRGMEDLV